MADFAVSISPDSTVLAGSSHTLRCQGVRGDDQADGTTLEVEWFNPDGVPISEETNGVMITGVTKITTNATLISYLSFPTLHTSQAGPYTCIVRHTIPDTAITDRIILNSSVVTVQSKPLSLAVYVVMNISPSPVNAPHVMISASRSATLYEGTTDQILCCMITPDNAGVDTPTNVTRDITGPVDDNRVTANDTISKGVIIVKEAIHMLSLSDTGNYICTATVDSVPNNAYIVPATNTATLDITVEGTLVVSVSVCRD